MSERNHETGCRYARLDGTVVNGDVPQPNLSWRGAWIWCLRHLDYDAAELIRERNCTDVETT